MVADDDREVNAVFFEAFERRVCRLSDFCCDGTGVEKVTTEDNLWNLSFFTVGDDTFDDFFLLLKTGVPSIDYVRTVLPLV
jgi:hypothetical protein